MMIGQKAFWDKVDKNAPGNCWGWKAHRLKKGYGFLRVKGKPTLAHRYSWELHNGPIPEGMNVLHHCDNPCCSRPDHLFIGSQADNIADMIAKGRRRNGTSKGENNGMAKMDESKVRYIRDNYPILTMRELGHMFGITRQNVSCIYYRKTWKHVD